MTELNIHWVTSMEMSEPRLLSESSTWVRDLDIYTANSKHPITITFFADNALDQIDLKKENQ